MAKMTKTAVDKALRDEVFSDLFGRPHDVSTPEFGRWNKINDRQWGIILTDANGHDRYVKLMPIIRNRQIRQRKPRRRKRKSPKTRQSVKPRPKRKKVNRHDT